jgi:hypothetical protein
MMVRTKRGIIGMTTFDSPDPDIARGKAWHQPVDRECRAPPEPRAPQATS